MDKGIITTIVASVVLIALLPLVLIVAIIERLTLNKPATHPIVRFLHGEPEPVDGPESVCKITYS